MKKLLRIIQNSIQWVREHSIFQKFVMIMSFMFTFPLMGQYVKIPTHYDSEYTAKHIINGHIRMFLTDTVKWVVEKKPEHYISNCGMDSDFIKNKLDKVFSKGKPEYISRTNGGYVFTIAVVSNDDDTKVINYCTFHVDGLTQRIEEIEILLGE